EAALGVTLDHLEVQRGDTRVAVLAGHLHALEHTRRCGACADRSGRAVLLVIAVARALPLEVVALHGACEALPLADAGDVDALTGLEHIGVEHLADFEPGEVVDAQFGELAPPPHLRPAQLPDP